MLTHAEAQALVSARLDGPLDPIAARELEAHLASCASCRAFNTSSTQLMRELRSMPYLPASPAVKRAVIDHIKTSRSPWNVVSGPWLARAVPVAAAIAATLLLTLLGAFAFQGLNDPRSPLDAVTSFLSQPASETESPDGTAMPQTTEPAAVGQPSPQATATDVPEPTATDVPEPTATDVPEPTATDVPEPTATEVPEPTATDVPEPTATDVPEPTATDVPEPTPTDVPEPTATDVPEPTATDVPEPTATEVPQATATEVPEPTATDVPEPTATDVPEPTATDVPEPTATDVPELTATDVPTQDSSERSILPAEGTVVDTDDGEATPQDLPARIDPAPEPDSTAPPDPARPLPSEPTTTDAPEPTRTAAPEPAAPSVATETPTEIPNEQIIVPVDGTVIESSDEEATEEVTSEDGVPTPERPNGDDITPGISEEDSGEDVIVPADPQTPVDTSGDEDIPGGETPVGDDNTGDGDAGSGDQADGGEEGVIEPVDGVEATQDASGDASNQDGDADQATETPDQLDGNGDTGGDDGGEGIIVPSEDSQATEDAVGGTSDAAGDADEDTSGSGNAGDDSSGSGNGNDDEAGNGDAPVDDSGTTGDGGEESTGDTGQSLGSAQEVASVAEVPGDPGTRLGVDGNSIAFSVNPGRVSLEGSGITLQTDQTESGQAVFACNGSGSCIDVSSASADGFHSDYPLGWIGSNIIYERTDENGDVSFRAVQIDSDSLEVIDDSELGSGSETLVRPYPLDGGLLVPSPDAWLLITADGVSQIDANPYGSDIGLFRFKPSSDTISYVAGGEIIVASLGSPGTPIAQVPFTGTDFDVSPDGSQIVVTDGSGIRILDLDGNVVQEFPNDEEIAIDGVAWPEGRGIIYVDATNGVIRSIEP